jgi:hypothetical protein
VERYGGGYLEQLRPKFQDMVGDMTGIVLISSDGYKQVYDVLREQAGQTYGYPVTFVGDERGNWKIFEF